MKHYITYKGGGPDSETLHHIYGGEDQTVKHYITHTEEGSSQDLTVKHYITHTRGGPDSETLITHTEVGPESETLHYTYRERT